MFNFPFSKAKMGIFKHLKISKSKNDTIIPPTIALKEKYSPDSSVELRPPPSSKDAENFLRVKLEEVFKDGKYIVKGHLGSGRYSSVWLAEDME